MFLGSGISVATIPTLLHYNVSRILRWRSSKPEVTVLQLVEELETRFQMIIHVFEVGKFSGATLNIATPQRKSKFKMATLIT